MDDKVKTNGLERLAGALVTMGDVLIELLREGEYQPLDMGEALGERLVLVVGPEAQDVQLEFFAGFLWAMPEIMRARMLLNFPLTEGPGHAEGRVNRKLALAIADELGPDWAQTLYRLSVLVTKLA